MDMSRKTWEGKELSAFSDALEILLIRHRALERTNKATAEAIDVLTREKEELKLSAEVKNLDWREIVNRAKSKHFGNGAIK